MRKKYHLNELQLSIFYRQFSTLLSAGIPVIGALALLETTQTHVYLRFALMRIRKTLLSGKSVFKSFHTQPLIFDHTICQIIRVGEETGTLDNIFLHLANHYQYHYKLKKELQQACVYPAFIITIAVIVFMVMIVFIVPRFEDFFLQTQIKIPAITQWLFTLSSALRHTLLPLFILLFITACCGYMYNDRYRLSHLCSKMLFKLPIVYSLYTQFYFLQFNKMLVLTLSAGIPLFKALEITQPIAASDIQIKLIQVKLQISKGTTFCHALSSAHFPQRLEHQVSP